MVENKPTITALMTTYNSAHHVKETMESILNQTYRNFVFLILDDGSTDDTIEVIKTYQDKRIKLIENKENKGVGYRLRQAVELVDTLYIAKVDSDDISCKDRFAKQLAYMQENPNLDIIKSLFSYFPDTLEVEASERYKEYKTVKEKEHNSINTPELITKELPRWSCFAHTTYFAKSKTIKDLQYPDTRYGEDYYLFLTALNMGYTLGCLQKTLLKFRVSNYSVTKNTNSPQYYLETLYNLKKDKINKLYSNHKDVWIFGSGGLAKNLYKTLTSKNYKVKGFIERNCTSSIIIDNKKIKTINISKFNEGAVIIAAQPVRNELLKILENKQLVEWKDYMVIA